MDIEAFNALSDEEKVAHLQQIENLKKQQKKEVKKPGEDKTPGRKVIKVIKASSGGLPGQARQAIAKDKAVAQGEATLSASIKFNMGIEKFVKDNKAFLPEEAQKMLELANKTKFSTETIKANEIRSGLIKAFCEKERFIANLPQAVKDKVALFKSLAEDEKARRSSEFWEIVEIGIDLETKIKRANSKNKAFSNDDAYSSKWKSAGAIFKKKEK